MKLPPWVLTKENLPYLIETRLNKLDWSKKWVVNISELKDKRTLPQNARLWKLYESIGNYLGYTKDEMHDYFGQRLLRYQTEICGEIVERVESTTQLSTERMAWYQEQIEIIAASMGWGDVVYD